MQPDPAPEQHIGNYLSEGGVSLALKARNRDEALRELIGLIPVLVDLPEEREKLFQALKDREDLCSTGVGDGVALPHSRNALVGLVRDPVIVFGRKLEGLPYASIDGAPVKLFFLLVAPNVTVHLRILARLSRLLRNPHVLNNLLTAESISRVLSIIKVNEVDLDALPSQ